MSEKHIPTLEGNVILKRAQKSRNTTQVKIAKCIGFRPGQVSLAMRYSYGPTLSMFEAILDALDYNVVIQDRVTGNIVFKLHQTEVLDDDI